MARARRQARGHRARATGARRPAGAGAAGGGTEARRADRGGGPVPGPEGRAGALAYALSPGGAATKRSMEMRIWETP